MEYKLFIADYNNNEYLIIRAETKEEVIKKIKNKERWNKDDLLIADKEVKIGASETIKSIGIMKDGTLKTFCQFFFNREDIIIMPKFNVGYKSVRALRALCEERWNMKLVSSLTFNKIKKDLKRIDKVEKYDRLKKAIRSVINNY